MGASAVDVLSLGLNNVFRKPSKPKRPVIDNPREADREAAEAREAEEERLRRGRASADTRRSGSVTEALSADIGRTNLGGTA